VYYSIEFLLRDAAIATLNRPSIRDVKESWSHMKIISWLIKPGILFSAHHNTTDLFQKFGLNRGGVGMEK